MKGAWFKSLDLFSLNKRGVGSVAYTLDLGCGLRRHWQFSVTRHVNGQSSNAVIHFPKGGSNFTTDTDIDLGDLAEAF